MTHNADIRTGGCLCGAVRFTTKGPVREVVACHCGQCRRQTGLYHAATSIPNDRLSVEGGEAIRWYRTSDHARRGFCSPCGSALFWSPDEGDFTSVLAGAFDEPSGLKLTAHIFCADKGDFYEITDSLPLYPGSRGGPPAASKP
ncbi:GFA family protein [Roseovarius amoyensis]|uniref:GFA family protein n=1 Tax=Roseovarius amoyensis TaxID=2211448 RepID=UPI000DBE5B26|nr:GFA family protein [Roseovarius amoyensis]